MSSAVIHVDHFKHVPIAEVRESSTNPRRHFDKKGMEELTASVQTKGVIIPLVVVSRQNKGEDWFEIVAGARRYRAAKAAGLEQLPVIVRQLSAEEVLETQVIENLQREDVHPLDEAKGYEALMAAPYKMKVETVAAKVGKSVKYIYDSKKLLELTKEARELFWGGLIDKGHAILLARLTPTEQAKVIGTKKDEYADGGLFHPCRGLYDEEGGFDDSHVKACSVRELEDYLKRHIRFSAKQADAFLFPDTVTQVSAATETKRKIIEITHEYLADDDVRHADSAKIYGERAWQRADGHEDSTTCDRSVLGVIVSGPGQGEAFNVCINKDRCLVHWGKEIRAREKRAKDREQGNTAAVSKADRSADAARQRQNDEYERLKRKRADWEKLTPAVLKAIDAKLPSISTKASGPLGDLLVKAFSDWGRAKTNVPRGKTAEDLVRHLAGLYLCRVVNEHDAYEKVPKLAKHLGVDLTKILKPDVHTSAVKGKKGKAA